VLLDLVSRGKVIDGNLYPYSPSPAGAKNKRAILEDAVAEAKTATAPREWEPGDLESVIKTVLNRLQDEGTLASCKMEELAPNAGRFRGGWGLRVNQLHTRNGGPDAADPKPAA
jgi:hypothetical protein